MVTRRARAVLGSVAAVLPIAMSLLVPQVGSCQEPADFLFAAPRFSVGIRTGYSISRADSEIHDFLGEQLTLDRSAFDGPILAMDFSWHALAWLDAMVGIEISGSSEKSEYREFVDLDDQPIKQKTRITRVPLTLSAKLYPLGRGKQVGEFAWIPKAVVPYLGAGLGATYYELKQKGDFVDISDLSVFSAVLRSQGWAFAGHAFAGLDIKLTNRLGLIVEGRYYWASDGATGRSGNLGGDFIGFAPIDLDGGSVTVGINWKL